MLINIKAKNTDNFIGLKEDIAMRLEGVVDIERIDIAEGGEKCGRSQMDKDSH